MSLTQKPAAPAGKSAAQLLEEQQRRFRALTERRTKVEVELQTATRQYTEAQAEAQREFGTGDLNQLRALYAQREQDNNARVAQFIQELDALEKALAETEAQLAA